MLNRSPSPGVPAGRQAAGPCTVAAAPSGPSWWKEAGPLRPRSGVGSGRKRGLRAAWLGVCHEGRPGAARWGSGKRRAPSLP